MPSVIPPSLDLSRPDFSLQLQLLEDEKMTSMQPLVSPRYLLPAEYFLSLPSDLSPSLAGFPSDDIFFPPSYSTLPYASSAYTLSPDEAAAWSAPLQPTSTFFNFASFALPSPAPPPVVSPSTRWTSPRDELRPPAHRGTTTRSAAAHDDASTPLGGGEAAPSTDLGHDLRTRPRRASSSDSEGTLAEDTDDGDFKVVHSADEGHDVGASDGTGSKSSSRKGGKKLKGTTLRDVLEESSLSREEYDRLTPAQKRTLRNKSSARAFRARKKNAVQELEGKLSERDSVIASLQAQISELTARNLRMERQLAKI